MELNEFIKNFDISLADAMEFFNDNNWFDSKPDFIDGKVVLSNNQIELYTEKLSCFTNAGTSEKLMEQFKNRFPDTSKVLTKFFKEVKLSDETRFYLIDFLLIHLKKDIVFYTNEDVEEMLNVAATELIHAHAELLTFFLAYTRTKRKTKYYKDYSLNSKKLENNDAYTFDEYIQILYYLFNENYIEDNEMYQKAARSKNYTDTWLFLTLHFICSLRMTDLERIYHPTLPKEPETVIDEIEKGTFSDNDAREVLLSITHRLCVLPLKPNKTKNSQNIANIKFIIPHSCEVHVGKLFALAEAHQQISGQTGPIVRKIASFEQITRYMGEEIGLLFLNCNFRSRKANKSFMQTIEMLSNDILGEDGTHIKGYILAGLARSHKSGYGQFASTAANYLRDAALSGLTPEFVAYELFERGVLSFATSMLIDMYTEGKYKQLEASEQTSYWKKLGMTVGEVEGIAIAVADSQKTAQNAIIQAVDDKTPVIEVLHRIGSGMAFSKQPECLCLLSAANKSCPYSHDQCIGCKFEISTKSTFYQMASEYNRVAELYLETTDPTEKQKHKMVITDVIVPKLEEMLFQIRKTYGDKTYEDYNELVSKYVE